MALIILAGGESSRMNGGDKALLPLGDSTMIGGIITRLAPFFSTILVSARRREPYAGLPVQVIFDRYPGYGPLSGIHACLLESPDEYNLVLACDLPLFKAEVANYLLACRRADLVVPFVAGHPEMVAAVYAKRILPVIEEFLQTKNYKLRNLLEVLDVEFVPEAEMQKLDPELESFLNVNTPAEYAKVVEIVRRNEK